MPQIPFSNIKTQLKSIFDAANTTTGSPVDLSNGLTRRIQSVFKINPDKIPVQSDLFPFVTLYFDNAGIEAQTLGIGGSQANALRKASLNLNIFSAVNEPYVTDITADDADEQCEQLIANIDQIVRSNHDINSTLSWSIPNNISIHSIEWDEETHIRASIINLNCTLYY